MTERIRVISWLITINKFRCHKVCLYAVGISKIVAYRWQYIGTLRAKPLRADRHLVIVYVSKGQRVQYVCSVYHCLRQFLQDKTNSVRICFPPLWTFVWQKIWSSDRTGGGTWIRIKKEPPYNAVFNRYHGSIHKTKSKESKLLHICNERQSKQACELFKATPCAYWLMSAATCPYMSAILSAHRLLSWKV